MRPSMTTRSPGVLLSPCLSTSRARLSSCLYTSLFIFFIVSGQSVSQAIDKVGRGWDDKCELSNNLPTDDVCNFDIEIRENRSLNSTFQNCRIVLGFVIVRHVNLNWRPITFERLEVIRDFLFLDNVVSEDNTNANNSLNVVFPRLQAILGHRRLNSNTLSVLRYNGSEHLGLDRVELICGPIKIDESPGVCFQHSATYWRWVNKFNASAYNFPLAPIKRHDVNVGETSEAEGFNATITFRYKIQQHWPRKHNREKPTKILFVFYHIDRKYYEFLTTGRQAIGCSRNVSFFLISDVIYTHAINIELSKAFNDKSTEARNLKNTGILDALVHQPRSLVLDVDNRNNTYERVFDILSVDRYISNVTDPIQTRSPKNYYFRYGEYYIIKLEICFDNFHGYCEFEQIRLFNPQKKDYVHSVNGAASTPASSSEGESLGLFDYISWIFVTVIMVALFGVLLFRAKTFLWMMMHMKSYRQVQQVITINPGYVNMPVMIELSPLDTFCEIDRARLTVDTTTLLGKGEFGSVYVGWLGEDSPEEEKGGNNIHRMIKVAVKKLNKEHTSPYDKERFLKEAKLMKTLDSFYIVKLFGVCTLDDPMLVVMEFMEKGDLKTFLLKRYEDYLRSHDLAVLPSADQMIQMAIQVADGMYFLHSNKVIHRDLAARNIMVSENYLLKVGDFGLTRDIYQRDYYRLHEAAKMPLRWLAPEAIAKCVFTYATDVWSFGVVLWEIMSLGETPFAGECDQSARQMILDGVHLEKPKYCHALLWNISQQCWRKNPNTRMTFKQIVEHLYPFLQIERDIFEKHSYYVTNTKNDTSCSTTSTSLTTPTSPSGSRGTSSTSDSHHTSTTTTSSARNLYRKFYNIFSSNNRLN